MDTGRAKQCGTGQGLWHNATMHHFINGYAAWLNLVFHPLSLSAKACGKMSCPALYGSHFEVSAP
jgi:hypothetical protein